MSRRFAPHVLLVLLAAVASACGGQDDRRTLRIASDATFPPFHFMADAGGATGFDVELARELAALAGLEAQVIVLPYDDLFAGLAAGTHDVVAATTGITAEREALYLFSDPYFSTCQAAVVRNAAGEPTRLADLASANVAASGSGTAAAAMKSLDAEKHVSIDDGEGVRLLDERRIDAWIVDEFDAVAAARASNGRLRVINEPVAVEKYGLVLSAHDTQLKRTLDQGLAELASSGRLAELRDRFSVDRDADWPVNCRLGNQR